MGTIVVVSVLAVVAVGVALWFRSRKGKPVAGNGTGTIPTQVSPPTTAGGIIDQVNNGIGAAGNLLNVLSTGKDLLDNWSGSSSWSGQA